MPLSGEHPNTGKYVREWFATFAWIPGKTVRAWAPTLNADRAPEKGALNENTA
jgi:hypothetical protein